MSIDVQIVIRNTCLYDGGHFAVLMAMADCANTTTGDGIYPGMDLLAANSRLKQRRTQDIVQELREDRVVILQSDNGEDVGPEVQPTGGRGKKTEYRIDLDKVQELQGLHEAEVEAGRVKCHFCEARKKRMEWRFGKGAKNGQKGAISDVKGAIPSSHIRTHEPSIEPSIVSAADKSGLFDIPEWIPREVWEGFVEMRKKIRHPLTPRAVKLLVAELEKFRDQGHDPIAIINESTMKSWRGFFAPKQEGQHAKSGNKTGNGTSHQRHRAGWSEILDAEAGKSEGIPEPGQLALGPPEQRHPG